MRKFEAPTLEEAYAEAARAFSCSITELEIQVVQNPSRGFLGFGKKPAVIVATCPAQERNRQKLERAQEPRSEEAAEAAAPVPAETPETPAPEVCEAPAAVVAEEIVAVVEEVIAETPEAVESEEKEAGAKPAPRLERDNDIFDNFYNETPDIHAVVSEIEEKINALFEHACFDIDRIQVGAFDE
ncbi:Jag N-terminal domain-containing protein [Hydrogenimonas sp.]